MSNQEKENNSFYDNTGTSAFRNLTCSCGCHQYQSIYILDSCPCIKKENKEVSEGWADEFDKARPEWGWMPKSLNKNEESEIRYFGYKYYLSDIGQVFEAIDWYHIKLFINKTLSRQREELIRELLGKLPKEKYYIEGASEYSTGFNQAIQEVTTLLKSYLGDKK